MPTFIFKTVGKSKSYNNKGGLLLIEKSQEKRIETWDTHCEFINYFEDQKKFVNALLDEPKKNLNIRLSSNSANFKFNEKSRWFDFHKSLQIDNGTVPIGNLISRSRLVVHSYDTGC